MTPSIGLLLLAGLLVYLWYQTLQAREHATQAAKQTCRRQQMQFLDDTVALRRVRVRRARSGQLALERTYRFEYSEEGLSRQEGFVIVLGKWVQTVGLAPPGQS